MKRWLQGALAEPGNRGLPDAPVATAPSAAAAYTVLRNRGACVAVVEASLKRTEDESPADLGRAVAALTRAPRLVLYTDDDQASGLRPNEPLAHALVHIDRPDVRARFLDAVRGTGARPLFLNA